MPDSHVYKAVVPFNKFQVYNISQVPNSKQHEVHVQHFKYFSLAGLLTLVKWVRLHTKSQNNTGIVRLFLKLLMHAGLKQHRP